MLAELTRKSIVGFGYNTSCEQVWNKSQTESFLQVCETTRPDFQGTVKTVSDAIVSDRGFQSIKSGGTYYTSAWFIKIAGKWHKISDEFFSYKADELYSKEYRKDSVMIEIE